MSAFVLLGFIYWNTVGFMVRQTDQTLEAEIKGLEEQFRRDGIITLAQVIQERSENAGDSLYLLTDRQGRIISGNLEKLPPIPDQKEHRIEFELEGPGGDGREIRVARAHFLRLFAVRGRVEQVTGYLIVGRDIHDRKQIENMITAAIAWGGALMVAVGIAGGTIISRNIVRRLEVMNETSRQVMAGDLSMRIPVDGSGDEIDQLGMNLNAMLGQIETLMSAMREVTDNIAHDLRSPLNRLRTRIEVTLMKDTDVKGYRSVLVETIAEADNLLSTFNALLSIARIEAGTSNLELVELDPAEIAQDMADLYAPVCEEHKQHFHPHIQKGLKIRANRELISQALSNLLDNAIKYSGPNSDIDLDVMSSSDNKQVILAVRDSGPGIALGDRERVTQRFVRLETSRSQPGSGLGLSLVSAIAQLHQARLQLTESDPLSGNGLRVALYMPRL